MDWISGLLVEQNSLQAVVIILLIIAIGLGFGRMKVAGVSLGVTFVFFCGILAGHLGLRINSQCCNSPRISALSYSFMP